MTTKHVVADDTAGKIAVRCLEVQRRVIEGTLPSEDVLDALQGIIEGKLSSPSPDSNVQSDRIREAVAQIAKERKEGDLHASGFGRAKFHHVETGRYYFIKRCCGTRALQVKVFYLRPNGNVSRGADEALCTICLKHEHLGDD
jgi:hypothetical protein